MIKVVISKQSNYPISSVKVKNTLTNFLIGKGIVSDSVVFVSFVGKEEMKKIGKTYYKKDDRIHNVFSFVESEVQNKNFKVPNEMINLGEIIVCFPVAVEEAAKEGVLIEAKVLELVEHSALHLMGIHHKED